MINTITEQKRYHYVYQLTNTKPLTSEYLYIGVHSSDTQPQDDNYMSSSNYIKRAIKSQGNVFKKEILSIWKTREEASLEERRLLTENKSEFGKTFYNRKIPSIGFDTTGFTTAYDTIEKVNKMVRLEQLDSARYVSISLDKVCCYNTKTNVRLQVTKEEFESNISLVGFNKDRVSVFEKSTGESKQVTSEEFTTSNNYISINKGRTSVKDSNGNIKSVFITQDNKDDYIKSDLVLVSKVGEDNWKKITNSKYIKNKSLYKTPSMNKVPVRNIETNETFMVDKDEYVTNDLYVSALAKVVRIYDENGVLRYTSEEAIAKFGERNNLPWRQFKTSYQNNGSPIYQDLSNISLIRITKNGNIKYKGWYAIKEA